jgi:hypothetical protein
VLPLRTWKRYDSDTLAYLPFTVEATSVVGSFACAPPVGDDVPGAGTFNVEPSAAAEVSDCAVAEGEVGVGDDLLQAIASASAEVTVQYRTFRFIQWNSVKLLW